MSDMDFGKQLRTFRQLCRDPQNGKLLSQQRLGELLGDDLGTAGFSGAAVSDWERGVSRIHAGDRLVLLSLLKVMSQKGGINSPLEANILLESGNYRALNPEETGRIFQQKTRPNQSPYKFLPSFTEFQNLLNEAREGPNPVWTHVAITLLRKLTDSVSVLGVFRALVWFWIWIAAYLMLASSLYGFFHNPETVIVAIAEYVCASLILPLCIGALTNTKDNPFWRRDEDISNFMLRLYTYQGAYIGFHLGYFVVFALRLLTYFLQVRFSLPAQFLLVGFPLLVGNLASQVVPYNLWRAFGRLRFSDGAIFFVFVPLGFLWGWFLFQFHALLTAPTSGIIVVLAAITLLVSLMTLQYRRRGNTIIPAHWWIILYGLILICQVILALTK